MPLASFTFSGSLGLAGIRSRWCAPLRITTAFTEELMLFRMPPGKRKTRGMPLPVLTSKSFAVWSMEPVAARSPFALNWAATTSPPCPQSVARHSPVSGSQILADLSKEPVKEDLQNYENYLAGARARLKLSATLKNIPTPRVKEDLQNYENYLAGARARLKLSATLKNIPTPRFLMYIIETHLADEGELVEQGGGYTFFWKGLASSEPRRLPRGLEMWQGTEEVIMSWN
ncbi:hypothetical protein MSG28_010610 [Choristoneura fumiferana]|uniref:Uncharacterized protein n=1 Tax=Choristoneura fumiferana TaxID=7141 RepID=A0ACC0KP71_CHOFU|nr:hypothetical protein MSG28_010610 [Choristoneura fumiferana]